MLLSFSSFLSITLSLSFPVRKNFPKRSLTDRLPRTSNRWLLPSPISKLIVGRGRKWAIMQAIWALKKSFQRPAMYQYITLPSHQIVQFPLPFHLCGWLFAPTYRGIFPHKYETPKSCQKVPNSLPWLQQEPLPPSVARIVVFRRRQRRMRVTTMVKRGPFISGGGGKKEEGDSLAPWLPCTTYTYTYTHAIGAPNTDLHSYTWSKGCNKMWNECPSRPLDAATTYCVLQQGAYNGL